MTESSRAFHALTLVAAARTAAHASRAVAERRAGRDASDQQAETPARAGLAEVVADLRLLLVRLRVRLASGAPADRLRRDGGETAALVQAFEGRLVLDDVARAARRAHQTLLSLYPAVDAETAEGARRIALDAQTLASADTPDVAVLAADLADWLDLATA